MKASLLLIVTAAAAFAAAPTYKVITKIKIGGGNRWDYSYVDNANHRLYVSHGTQTEVIDTNTDKLVGTIMGTNGVHGIAIADDLGLGFTSDGGDNDVTVFDIKTLAVKTKIKTGQNPDSIIYEPTSHRIFTFNGRSSDSTAIDAKTLAVVAASIPLGGKPEFSQIDGKGHIYVNLEDKNEIVELDAKNALVARRYSIAPCEGPSGLAFDLKKTNLLFGLRKQNDDRQQSRHGQGDRDSRDRRGTGWRCLRRRVCIQRQRPGRQHHHGRRNFAGQVRARGHHPNAIRRADHRRGSEGAQAVSAGCGNHASRGGRRKQGKNRTTVPDSFEILVVGR